ncbi:hypothetical protein KTAU_25680 [Thermogemmatispora aurantia]|uniref:Uncharacterized protein n=1 Tax=Thermogemmatispora aurantia TaxID=2045279 RepID=A0A5J4KB94_9CHLR|nr:hypothetical protein KTAU_25680 [Thermogemmatispora aurantia]
MDPFGSREEKKLPGRSPDASGDLADMCHRRAEPRHTALVRRLQRKRQAPASLAVEKPVPGKELSSKKVPRTRVREPTLSGRSDARATGQGKRVAC